MSVWYCPLLFKNGQTLGKKIFGVALMRNDGVRIGHVTLLELKIIWLAISTATVSARRS